MSNTEYYAITRLRDEVRVSGNPSSVGRTRRCWIRECRHRACPRSVDPTGVGSSIRRLMRGHRDRACPMKVDSTGGGGTCRR